MLWNTFDDVRSRLNLYDNPHFEAGSGINDREQIIDEIKEIEQRMSANGEPRPMIKARIIEFILDNAAIEVNPIDWFGLNFCGWITWTALKSLKSGTAVRKPMEPIISKWIEGLEPTEEYAWAVQNYVQTGTGDCWPDYAHSVPDWDSVIQLGFPGLLERARFYYDEKVKDGTLTADQEVYYQSIFICYEALLRMLDRFIECAKKHIEDDEKMPVMVECLEVLRHSTPKTLYQFLMIIYLYHLFQEQLDVIQARTLGNLDVDGYPFYKKDLEEGRLTPESAEELFRFFFEKYTNQGHLHSQPLYFGGFDENGECLINELSYIMLTGYDKSGILNPKLFVKVMPNTPDDFIKKGLDMIRRGRSSIIFVNEELGIKISKKLGRTDEESRRLVATGCSNFASRGKETTPEHVYVNLVKGIELVFNNGRDIKTGDLMGVETGDVVNFKTFEEFKAAYIKQIEHLINKAFIISDFYDLHLLDMNPAPIYSASMPDSVKNGKDAYYNGVKYNNTLIFLSCHATVADSLMMVKKHVYDNNTTTMSELRDAIMADWEGYEELRAIMKNDPEKFGNNIDSVDNISCDLFNHFTSIVTTRKNTRGGHYVVEGESIWFSHRWADKCSATPDGRKRGDCLSKNMGASEGQDRRGVTALIQSVTKIDATNLAYGAPFDYMLHPTAVQGDDGLDAMLGLLRTFMKRGGYGFQGNVHDSKTLKDAQVHPENHQGLQVRICGWSWYFTKMDKNFQDEFIRRAEYEEQKA